MNKAANKNPDGKTLAVISAKIFSAFGLALTLSLAASAQERVLLATQADTPVAQRQDASTIASLSGLQQTAVQAGSVRVIVGLRVPFSQEAWLPASAVAEQRDEIALMQSSMLRRFPSLATAPHSVDRFETIPFMGLTVTPNELADLANSPEVISIERDQLAVPNLHYSVPHIGGNTALASGYSGAGQTVAVLDSGVLKNHSFLQGKVVSEACYSSVSGTTIQSLCPGGATESTAVNSALPCSLDGCDHGTHVAGIVAGSGSSDFSGVAKDAKIIAIQVFSRINDSSVCADLGRPAPCTASRSVDQIKALERVYSLRGLYNIASVNISLGGGNYNGTCDSQQPSVKAIIDQLASVGIATVVASG
ncbi:S8 family serine peptidase, partial [Delftia tsuruhatensis]